MTRQDIERLRGAALNIESEHDEVLDLAIIVARLCGQLSSLYSEVRAIDSMVTPT